MAWQGGNFYKRAKMYLPGGNFYSAVEPKSYTDKDMWVGNELVINYHRFRLTGADEYALRYMELHNEAVGGQPLLVSGPSQGF